MDDAAVKTLCKFGAAGIDKLFGKLCGARCEPEPSEPFAMSRAWQPKLLETGDPPETQPEPSEQCAMSQARQAKPLETGAPPETQPEPQEQIATPPRRKRIEPETTPSNVLKRSKTMKQSPGRSSKKPPAAPAEPEIDENQSMAKLIAEGIAQSPEKKKEVLRRQKAAKATLRARGLDFNAHFQAWHKGKQVKLKPGHWFEFLDGVAGLGDISCRVCQSLLVQFGIDRVADEASTEQTDAASQGALVAREPDEVASPPKKRLKAGRPSKQEDREDAFNLMKYLDEQRPGMYRFLDQAEATARLPAEKKKSWEMVKKEMAKRPVQCQKCGGFFHLPHLSNNLALCLVKISFFPSGRR